MEYLKTTNSTKVRFISSLSREDLPRVGIFDIGLVPMITASIPNKVFDYIASGLPDSFEKNDSSILVEKEGLGWSCSYDEDDMLIY